MDIKYYQIDEVSKITELTKRTIRYYEDMGLYTTTRTDAGYRLYTDEDINIIKEIKNLRIKLGLTLIEVKRIIKLKKFLDEIFEGKDRNIVNINNSIAKVTELIDLVREREEILKKVEEKCNEHLITLNTILNKVKEEKNEE